MHAQPESVPPRGAPIPPLAIFAGIVAIIAVLGSGAVLFFFDPTRHSFFPVCLFHELTGLNCPGCGGTRAAYQLLHGHVLTALRDNALFILILAGLLWQGMRFAVRKIRHQPATLAVPPGALWTLLVFAAVFTVLRNLPAFSWLSP